MSSYAPLLGQAYQLLDSHASPAKVPESMWQALAEVQQKQQFKTKSSAARRRVATFPPQPPEPPSATSQAAGSPRKRRTRHSSSGESTDAQQPAERIKKKPTLADAWGSLAPRPKPAKQSRQQRQQQGQLQRQNVHRTTFQQQQQHQQHHNHQQQQNHQQQHNHQQQQRKADPLVLNEWPTQMRRRRHVVARLPPLRERWTGSHIVYWVDQCARLHDNLALALCLWLSSRLQLPVVVLAVQNQYNTAALLQLRQMLSARHIEVLRLDSEHALSAWATQHRAHVVITDLSAQAERVMAKQALAQQLLSASPCPMIAVDSSYIVPLRHSTPDVARTPEAYRLFLQSKLDCSSDDGAVAALLALETCRLPPYTSAAAQSSFNARQAVGAHDLEEPSQQQQQQVQERCSEMEGKRLLASAVRALKAHQRGHSAGEHAHCADSAGAVLQRAELQALGACIDAGVLSALHALRSVLAACQPPVDQQQGSTVAQQCPQLLGAAREAVQALFYEREWKAAASLRGGGDSVDKSSNNPTV